MTSARANRRGMFALMGAMAAFAINDMILKLTAQRYPLGEVITVRGTIATLLVGSVLIGLGQVRSLRAVPNKFVLTRTALDGMAMVMFTTPRTCPVKGSTTEREAQVMWVKASA